MPVPAALTESESCLTTAFAELGLGLRCRPPLCRWIEQEAQGAAGSLGGNRPGLLLFVQSFDPARRNFARAIFWMTCPGRMRRHAAVNERPELRSAKCEILH